MNGTDKHRPLGVQVGKRIHALPKGLENRLLGFIAGELAGTGVATAQAIAGCLDKLEAQPVADSAREPLARIGKVEAATAPEGDNQ